MGVIMTTRKFKVHYTALDFNGVTHNNLHMFIDACDAHTAGERALGQAMYMQHYKYAWIDLTEVC